ncbi:uridine kinase [Hathewaya histolytica]|uniref:Uridine kinase n=1 Tax=Hathewaya histolytica TaxID=1498 RepID=A0A4U9RIJ5_HATHI|nr:uridine kinase [Hathewaya histolytica]VTQ90373.1 uridine kinase [Hathewaya histolytica]
MEQPLVIGITGGSGSGKSTIAKEICDKFGEESLSILEMDSYYKDQSFLSFEERKLTNYDHPDAFDMKLLIQHVKDLIKGEEVQKPLYDFEVHNRKQETLTIKPRKIIIVEGILVLLEKKLRELLDIKIYVDTDPDVRFIRRLVRDINERGRTIDSVIEQYLGVVRPMHMQFTEYTKKYADIIVPEGGHNKVAIDCLSSKIESILQEER